MTKLGNYLTLFVGVLLYLSLLSIIPTNAQLILPLSPPQFTVEFVDRSYDVPKTTWPTTDPFTGEQKTIVSGGNHVTNRTIDVTITNQPFTPITLDNGTIIQLYYSVRAKGHFEDWANVRGSERMSELVPKSTSGFTTTVTLVLDPTNPPYYDVPADGKEDFQVKAVAGYYYQRVPDSLADMFTGSTFVNLTESDWSNTQTITVGQDPKAAVPELHIMATLPLLIVVPLVAIFFVKKRTCLKASN